MWYTYRVGEVFWATNDFESYVFECYGEAQDYCDERNSDLLVES